MAGTQRRSVVVAGAVEHEQFRPALEWLAAVAAVRVLPDLAEAATECRRAPPGTVVVAQSRPGQFSATAVEALHAAAPLARLVVLLGSWCEGETRTGRPWPGVTRVYWHQLVVRFRREWHARASMPLPRTATDAEQFLSLPREISRGGLVVLRSTDRRSFEALADVLGDAGFSVVRLPEGAASPVVGAAAGLWQCAREVGQQREGLRQFTALLSPAPVLVLSSFPREDDLRETFQAGAAGLLGEPLLVADLVHELEHLVGEGLADTGSTAENTSTTRKRVWRA